MNRFLCCAVALYFVLNCIASSAAPPDDGRALQVETDFATIQPLLKSHCFECHRSEQAEADVDLTLFTSIEEVRRHPATWIKVREMLDSGQMPPKEARQPTDDERQRLRDWVRDHLMLEAEASAGDPGRIVLRRLSNAEYTYTLRDLTGIDSLDPAKEFPIDGAAGEGFTNTGSALVMSPSLVQKYLDAAKQVASHLVLLPDGMRFSRHLTQRDRTDAYLARIREFYAGFSASEGATEVNLQGIVFNTNQGGRLPVEKYVGRHACPRRLEKGQ